MAVRDRSTGSGDHDDDPNDPLFGENTAPMGDPHDTSPYEDGTDDGWESDDDGLS